jgi:hypothetical protein
MHKRKVMPVVLAAAVSMLTGCRVLVYSVAITAGAIGLAGYAVYKTGDAAVTGTGKAVKSTGNALSSGTKSATTVIFANGEFKTEYAQDVMTVWEASTRAFQKARFENISGKFDALSGELTARTVNDTEIVVKLKNLGPQSTETRIRIGVQGDLKRAEVIHGLILRELPAPVVPQPASTSTAEVKS